MTAGAATPPSPSHRTGIHLFHRRSPHDHPAHHRPPGPGRSAGAHPALHRRTLRRLGRRRCVRRARPRDQPDLSAGRRGQEGRHRPRRRRRPEGVHRRPVAADAAARAFAGAAPHRRHRGVARRAAGGARVLRLGAPDHAGARSGPPRGRELPLLRRPDRGPDRRRLQGARSPTELRQPQADRGRRAHHAVEHPLHARVVEARPRARHRQHRGAQARGVHAPVGIALGRDLRGGGASRGRVQPRQRSRRGCRRRPRQAPRCSADLLHGRELDGAADLRQLGALPEGPVDGAGRQEPRDRVRGCRPGRRDRRHHLRSSRATPPRPIV